MCKSQVCFRGAKSAIFGYVLQWRNFSVYVIEVVRECIVQKIDEQVIHCLWPVGYSYRVVRVVVEYYGEKFYLVDLAPSLSLV